MRQAWLIFLLLVGLGMVSPGWAAIVPDGSVTEKDADAPKLPDDPRGKVRSSPQAGGSNPKKPTPARTPTAKSNPIETSEKPASGSTSGSAFGDSNSSAPQPGEARPLQPLQPASVSTASSAPLWGALVVFLMLASGGFWLSRRREQEPNH